MEADYGAGPRKCLEPEDVRVEDAVGVGRDFLPTAGRPIAFLSQRDIRLVEVRPPICRTFTIGNLLVEEWSVARLRVVYAVEFQATADDKALGQYGDELVRRLVEPRRFVFTTGTVEGVPLKQAVRVEVSSASQRALERFRPTGETDPMGQALYVVEQVGKMWTVEVECTSTLTRIETQKQTASVFIEAAEVGNGT